MSSTTKILSVVIVFDDMNVPFVRKYMDIIADHLGGPLMLMPVDISTFDMNKIRCTFVVFSDEICNIKHNLTNYNIDGLPKIKNIIASW